MTTKTRVALAGAGKIGEAIAVLLRASGDYEISVLEKDYARLAPHAAAGLRTHACDLGNERALAGLIAGHDAVISAAPFSGTWMPTDPTPESELPCPPSMRSCITSGAPDSTSSPIEPGVTSPLPEPPMR